MTVETASFLNDLNTTLPDGGDSKSEGDQHLRLIKTVDKATFPGMAGRAWRTQSKSSGYTAVATDNMSTLRFTASATLTLTAAATLGNGWMALLVADGGAITIDGDGTEKVNGATTYTVPDGYMGVLVCSAVASDEFYIMTAQMNIVDPTPPGIVAPYAGATAPTGWLLCYGQAVSQATYPALYAILGTTYGSDAGGNFTLPDLRGRAVAGQDDMGGTSANRLTGISGSVNGDTLGGVGGEEGHSLSSGENATHAHGVTDPTHAHSYGVAAGAWTSGGGLYALTGAAGGFPTTYDATGISIQNSGSGTAHNTVQPTIILNYIIKT